MGISAGLGSLLAAGIGAWSSARTQSANAAAQSSINDATMAFNRTEAKRARDFEHQEAAINRLFNQRQANSAMSFSANQAAIDRDWQADQALQAMQFEALESKRARSFEASQAAAAQAFSADEALKQRNWSSGEAAVARQFDAQQSLLARQFEERMSNSAHQREVRDLRLAGLNPILSATGGAGASTPVAPVIGAPLPSGAVASGVAGHGVAGHGHAGKGSSGQGFSASGQAARGIAASVGGLNAYMKKDIFKEFVNSALEGYRLDNDIKRAKAEDLNAQANMMRAVADDKRAVQEIEESVSRVQLNYDQHEINIFKKQGEEALARLYNEKVLSEVQKRNNDKKVSDAMEYNLRKTGDAAAAAAGAQIKLADLKEEIEHAESPARIKNLRSQADMYKSIYDKNEWAITDPKSAAQRKWWRENPEAAHANEFLDILGNVWHGNVSLHGGN